VNKNQCKVKMSMWMLWTCMWSGGILKLDTKLGWVVRFMPRLLNSRYPEIIYVRNVWWCRRVDLTEDDVREELENQAVWNNRDEHRQNWINFWLEGLNYEHRNVLWRINGEKAGTTEDLGKDRKWL